MRPADSPPATVRPAMQAAASTSDAAHRAEGTEVTQPPSQHPAAAVELSTLGSTDASQLSPRSSSSSGASSSANSRGAGGSGQIARFQSSCGGSSAQAPTSRRPAPSSVSGSTSGGAGAICVQQAATQSPPRGAQSLFRNKDVKVPYVYGAYGSYTSRRSPTREVPAPLPSPIPSGLLDAPSPDVKSVLAAYGSGDVSYPEMQDLARTLSTHGETIELLQKLRKKEHECEHLKQILKEVVAARARDCRERTETREQLQALQAEHHRQSKALDLVAGVGRQNASMCTRARRELREAQDALAASRRAAGMLHADNWRLRSELAAMRERVALLERISNARESHCRHECLKLY